MQGAKKIIFTACHLGKLKLAFTRLAKALVVQTLDSAIHRINLYPADGVIDFCDTYPLDSDLSGE